jgi:hypothetical protein
MFQASNADAEQFKGHNFFQHFKSCENKNSTAEKMFARMVDRTTVIHRTSFYKLI